MNAASTQYIHDKIHVTRITVQHPPQTVQQSLIFPVQRRRNMNPPRPSTRTIRHRTQPYESIHLTVSTPEPTPHEETQSQLFTKDDDPLPHTRIAITRRNEDPLSRVRERSNHYSNGLSDTTATINAARQYRHCDYITVAMSEYICGYITVANLH